VRHLLILLAVRNVLGISKKGKQIVIGSGNGVLWCLSLGTSPKVDPHQIWYIKQSLETTRFYLVSFDFDGCCIACAYPHAGVDAKGDIVDVGHSVDISSTLGMEPSGVLAVLLCLNFQSDLSYLGSELSYSELQSPYSIQLSWLVVLGRILASINENNKVTGRLSHHWSGWSSCFFSTFIEKKAQMKISS